MLLVDSHCHLNFKDFAEDLDKVVDDARAAGVKVMQTICTDMGEFDEIAGIAERYDGVYCSVGVHPNEAGATPIPSLEELLEKARHPKCIGIGETGLDFFYENSPRDSQIKSFEIHMQASSETGLPTIVHARDADDLMAEMLEKAHGRGALTGVLHCFSSGRELAERALKIGFYISISGIATFKKADDLRETIKAVPLDRLLVETDAPYLAPMPHRGKRNEPAFVRFTNKMVAELKGVSEEECARITSENFFRLFSKAKPPAAA